MQIPGFKSGILLRSLVWTSLYMLSSGPVEAQPIDRFKLVNRHNVLLDHVDPLGPLSVGNGDFAFTADVTGFQTFEQYYHEQGIPLETMCDWLWHSFPNTGKLELAAASREIDFHGRKIAYASMEKSPAGAYYRQNPHPVPLGQIGLAESDNKAPDLSAISEVHQKLDIWRGVLQSSYKLNGVPVLVQTVSDPEKSAVAFKMKSQLLHQGKLKIAVRFPYSYDLATKNKPAFDWSKPQLHETVVLDKRPNRVLLKRIVGETIYYVALSWRGKARFKEIAAHHFLLEPLEGDSIELMSEFSSQRLAPPSASFESVRLASERSWKDYWMKGGAVDLSESTDPRAPELERRIVLSQYLMKVNYAGSFPPQETGLTHISWYGKHNSEVYWWHAAQFYQWNRTELLEKSFNWYKTILPSAIAVAKQEGFDGGRWPKMAGIDGRTSPGSINPFIIWNQPNPIYLAELVYRKHPDRQTLNKYRDIVFESAKFLASYAFYDAETNRYILGPPLKSVNESTDESKTRNPSFELVQWYYGLKVAQDWRERLGMPRDAHWDDVLSKLSKLTISGGKYVEMETDPEMYSRPGGFSSAMLMALGYLPQTPMIDKEIMRHTFDAIYERNGLKSFVSWSLGKGAMTAARLGECKRAVDILCNDARGAVFLKNGHVQRAKEPLGCAAYLPANSAFLAAVELMAGGWDGAPEKNAPGFPDDGSWKVRVEGLNRLP